MYRVIQKDQSWSMSNFDTNSTVNGYASTKENNDITASSLSSRSNRWTFRLKCCKFFFVYKCAMLSIQEILLYILNLCCSRGSRGTRKKTVFIYTIHIQSVITTFNLNQHELYISLATENYCYSFYILTSSTCEPSLITTSLVAVRRT